MFGGRLGRRRCPKCGANCCAPPARWSASANCWPSARRSSRPPQPPALPSPMRGALRFDDVTFHYPTRPDAAGAAKTSTCASSPAKPSPWSARPAPARAPCSSCCCASTIRSPARSRSTASTCARSTLPDLRGAHRAGAAGHRDLLRPARRTTSATAARTPATPRCVAAAKAAEAHDFIDALPDGYATDTRRTRRAPVRRPAPAHRHRPRDAARTRRCCCSTRPPARSTPNAKRLVQHALERLMSGRTTIVIAHRLATVQRADRIVVMDGGRIVAQGTHESLLAEGGAVCGAGEAAVRGLKRSSQWPAAAADSCASFQGKHRVAVRYDRWIRQASVQRAMAGFFCAKGTWHGFFGQKGIGIWRDHRRHNWRRPAPGDRAGNAQRRGWQPCSASDPAIRHVAAGILAIASRSIASAPAPGNCADIFRGARLCPGR